MLVLSRNTHDKNTIRVGDLAYIKVNKVSPTIVRFAVTSEGVNVCRKEIYKKNKKAFPKKSGTICFSRKVDEGFMIGDDVEVIVTKIYKQDGYSFASLGIKAPKDIKILRLELEESSKKLLSFLDERR